MRSRQQKRRTTPTCSSSQPARTSSSFASTSWVLALEELAADFAPRSLSTSVTKLFSIIPCNLRFVPSLTGLIGVMQDGCHENTILSPTSFRERIGRARRFLRDYFALRSGCARWHMDQFTRHCLDNEGRRHV